MTVPRLSLRAPLMTQALQADVPVLPLVAPGRARGLLDSFRVARAEPERDDVVYVFPFDDPDWRPRIRAMLRFEAEAWRAWWTIVAHLDPEDSGVLRIPPLLGSPDERVVAFDLAVDGRALPALRRPMIDWPSLHAHPLTAREEDRLRTGDAGFDALVSAIWDFTSEPNERLDRTLGLQQLDPWHLLSDGEHVVPTQWRLLHRDFRHLDVGKECGAASGL